MTFLLIVIVGLLAVLTASAVLGVSASLLINEEDIRAKLSDIDAPYFESVEEQDSSQRPFTGLSWGEQGVDPHAAFLLALGQAESSWRFDAPMGDGDNVAPVYQLRPIYIEDADKDGIFDPQMVRPSDEMELVGNYMRRYAPKAWHQLYQPDDYESLVESVRTLARVHNGGPRGASKASTEAYGDKVVNYFKSLPLSWDGAGYFDLTLAADAAWAQQ